MLGCLITDTSAGTCGPTEGDAGQDQGQSAQLLNRQHFSGEHRAEQHARDGVEESDQSHGACGQVSQSGEPCGECQGGGHQGDVAEGEESGCVERGRRALYRYGDRKQEQTSGGELPGGRGDQVDVATPPLGKDVAEGRHENGRRRGEDSRPARRSYPREQHETYAGEPDYPTGQVRGPGPLGHQGPGDEHHRQRRHRHDSRGDARGQQLGGGVDEDEEHAHVDHAQYGGSPPPRTMGPSPAEGQQGEAGGQRPQGSPVQRAVHREELTGDEVVGPPGHRRDCGQRHPTRISFHGRQYNFPGS